MNGYEQNLELLKQEEEKNQNFFVCIFNSLYSSYLSTYKSVN